MNSIEFFFERPLLLLLLLPALAIILVPFFLLPVHRRKGFKKIAPVVIHCILVLLLSLILSGFTFFKITDKQAVFLLVDLSFSTEQTQNEIKARTEELLSLIHKNTPVGVVVFGADQIYDLHLEQNTRALTLSTPKGSATNIEGALSYLLTLVPEDKSCRVVLLSDGKQNEGKAENAAYLLAEKGIRVDAYYFDSTVSDRPEMQLSSFSAPEGAWEKEDCHLSCEIASNRETNAVLELYANGKLLSEQSVSLKKGTVPVVFTLSEISPGVHTYEARLLAPQGFDSIPQNNSALAALSVSGKEHLLVLADTIKNGEALASLLGEGFEVTVKRAHTAPKTIAGLCDYDSIVLMNVDYYGLPAGFTSNISKYVGAYGRNLFLVGGRDTFMFGSMEDSVLEELSPVNFKLEESPEGATVALMLVLDCSSSMRGEYLELAKQGAIKSLDALHPNDLAGVVSFHKEATLQSPLIASDNKGKELLTRVISGLEVGSGTYYTEAIGIATEELLKCDADIKHILFLSDGRPSDGGYYDAVIKANDQSITVSAIGLNYSSSVLDYMAYYGKGRYHYVESAEELPQIMLSEAESARINPTIQGQIGTKINRQSPLTKDLDASSLPPLLGYLGTTAKEHAEIHLETNNGHPLFATAEYGMGTVSCFTSDLGGHWSKEWLASTNAAALVRQMLTFTRPALHSDTSLKVTATPQGTGVHLSVNTTGQNASNIVYVTLKDPLGQEIKKELSLRHKGLYEGVVQTEALTLYEMTVVEETANHEPVDQLTLPLAVNWCHEYDAFASGGEGILATICNLTGGSLLTKASEGAHIALPPLKIPKNPHLPILILCGLLFLADVAIRRLRLKDIKEHFYEWKEFLKGKKGT